MQENIINTTNVNDTINTQQAEKQETVLVDNAVAENGGEQQPKVKKHTKLSEFQKMAGTLGILNWIGIATNMPILTTSIVGLINKEDDSFYKFALGSSLIGFCENISCLTYASIKLSKYKQNNKEAQTETLLENNEEKQNEEKQVEVISEEKKQEDKQTQTITTNQKLKNKSEELEKLNNEFSNTIANGIISSYKGTGTIL